MEWVIESSQYMDKQIRIINYCHTYLQVTTISELFDTKPQPTLLPYMHLCTRPTWFNKKQFLSIQQQPSAYQIQKIRKPAVAGNNPIKGKHPRRFLRESIALPPVLSIIQPPSCLGPHYISLDTGCILDSEIIPLPLHWSHTANVVYIGHNISDTKTTWTPTQGSIPTEILTKSTTHAGTIFQCNNQARHIHQAIHPIIPNRQITSPSTTNIALQADHQPTLPSGPQFWS